MTANWYNPRRAAPQSRALFRNDFNAGFHPAVEKGIYAR